MTEDAKEQIVENKEEIDFYKIINWSDEECAEFDKSYHFRALEFRDVCKKYIDLVNEYNSLYIQSEQLKGLIKSGYVIGYAISCPKCKVTYNVKLDELNFNKEIQCQDCGEKYIQNEHIMGLYVRDEAVNEKNI